MDEVMYGCIDLNDGSVYGCMDGWIVGWFDGWMCVSLNG
jgi:hypothetical protein